ncbi:MAG: Cna B-type domain-containing protein, partial [Clostridia bacterium]|nr:Cna B-type domain-containing protein [Clostridia bacterium]
AVPGYTTEIDGFNVTNSYIPETIAITGSKTWNDADDQDGKRPESITIHLLADGTEIKTAEIKPDETGAWAWSFTDLPKYRDQGVEIVYSITEAPVTGYTTEIDGFNVTNSYIPETTVITGSKTWNDANDQDGKRPESITISLLADGTEIRTAEIKPDSTGAWAWNFTALPKYRDQGVEIVYTITEEAVPGYITEIDGFNVTNHLPMVGFLKVDEQTGKPLGGATFVLCEGRLTAPEGTAVTAWHSGSEAKLLTGLKVGQTYTVFETETPEGFTTMPPFVFTVTEDDIPGSFRTFTVANRHIYRFRKLSATTGELVQNATLAVMQGDVVIDEWLTGTDNDGWHAVADQRFTAGESYMLVEKNAPEGYLQADPIPFTIDAETGLPVVNGVKTDDASIVMYDQPVPEATTTPEPTTMRFSVTKSWEDREDVLGLRPDSITVHLYRKTAADAGYPAEPYMTVTISDNGTDTWRFTFSDLPVRDGRDRRYTYMAQEETVEGYTVTYLNNGRTIINTIPEEDLPPTPTPTLPYITPTPAPTQRPPAGVRFIDGEWVYVNEYGVPLGLVPQTGDDTNFVLWGALVLLPLVIAALAALEIRRRKRLLSIGATGEEENR